MTIYYESELKHYGVLGMKWGHRKTQTSSANGSLRTRRLQRAVAANDRDVKSLKSNGMHKEAAAVKKVGDHKRAKLAKSQERDAYKQTDEYKADRNAKIKKAVKVGIAVAGVALASYGAYKFHDYIRTENAKLAQESGKKAAEHYRNVILAYDVQQHRQEAKFYEDKAKKSIFKFNAKKYSKKAAEITDKVRLIEEDGVRKAREIEKINRDYNTNVNFVTAAKNVYNVKRKR